MPTARPPIQESQSSADFTVTCDFSNSLPEVTAAAGAATSLIKTPAGNTAAVLMGPAPGDPTSLASSLAAWLEAGCAGAAPVAQGFVAVLINPRRRLVVGATGSRIEISLAYAIENGRVLLAANLPSLIKNLSRRPAVDMAAAAAGVFGSALWRDEQFDHTTGFHGVRRIPFGHVGIFEGPKLPKLHRWYRPEAHRVAVGGPHDEATVMRNAVTEAVYDSLPSMGPIAVAMSGGLDSTMVAATAATILRPSGRATLGLCHVPLAGAISPNCRIDVTDEPYADMVANATAGLELVPVRNHRGTTMIDVLPDAFEATYSPIANPNALVWMRDIADQAIRVGSQVFMTGQSGNVSFSGPPASRADLLRVMFRAGHWRALAAVMRARSRAGASRGSILNDALGIVVPSENANSGRGYQLSLLRKLEAAGVKPDFLTELFAGRYSWPNSNDTVAIAQADAQNMRASERLDDVSKRMLRFLLKGPPLPFSYQAYTKGLWMSDPFSDHRIVQLALSLPPESWIRDGKPRSLARRAATGLLPDAVRLRRNRGAQSVDAWITRVPRKQDYLNMIEEASASATASSIIDLSRLRASVIGWGALDVAGHKRWDTWSGRLLGLAMYLSWWDGLKCQTGQRSPCL